ncbi:MAG TPA: ABC transporter permease [Verrucomicrobiae bacterium]|nr:ABC transporter permease [Verrucomicrobiae bacterium]
MRRPKRMLEGLDEDIRDHIARETQDNIERGMSPEEARYMAMRKFGNVTRVKEETREVWIAVWLEQLIEDVRFGLRMLRKNPGFTAVAVLTLALGIGANTALFSVVNAVLIQPLPFENASRLVWSWGNCKLCAQAAVSPSDFIDYRAQNHSFEYFGGMAGGDSLFNLAGSDKPIQVKGSMVTAGFFDALGVQLRYGRAFDLSDEKTTDPLVVILSPHLWQERFGSDPNIIGKSVTLDDKTRTVVGVLANDVSVLSRADLWFPAPFQNQRMQSRRSHFFRPVGLLKRGVTISQAQAEMDTIAARLGEEYPVTNAGWGLRLEPLQSALVGSVRLALLVLLAAVGFVLLIACANVASLLLSRNSVRQREIVIRTAIGAGRSRLVRQLLTESLLLAIAGGAAGVFLATAGVEFLRGLGPQSLPRLDEVNVSGTVLAFTFFISIFTGILFGLGPALKASRSDLAQGLREGGAAGDARSKHRVHNALVVAEVALSVVVLIASGLLLNSFWRLMRVQLGFDPANVLTTEVALVSPRYDDERRRESFFRELEDHLRNESGAGSAGFVSELPLSGEADDTFFTIAEHPPANPNDTNDADIRIIDGDYFGAMRIPLLAGRAFERRDSLESRKVAIVNESFVKKFFPNEDPIGKHLKMFEGKPEFTAREIVGIVGANKHFALQESLRPAMFTPGSFLKMNVVVRSAGDPALLTTAVRQAVREIDPDEATSAFRTMDDVVSSSVAGDRFNALLLGAFGGIALLLTAAGIFGVLSYLVTQRTREIGLRVALGAQRSNVLRVIVGHGVRLALLGLCIGIVAAAVVTRWMSSVLFEVKPTDPLTFVAVVVVLGTVAFLASYLPARRAMRVDPMVALRHE